MNGLGLKIDNTPVSFSGVGLCVKHSRSNGKDYLTIDLWAERDDLSEYFLVVNGFTVIDCKNISDLQGRTFVLNEETQEEEPEGGSASGELLESGIAGISVGESYEFEFISLEFGGLSESHIPVKITASVFNCQGRCGVPVEGSFLAKIIEMR